VSRTDLEFVVERLARIGLELIGRFLNQEGGLWNTASECFAFSVQVT
jgi:hypothetical protein